MALVGPRHPHGRFRLSSELLALAWLSPGYCEHFENEPADVCVYLSLCLSAF